MRTIIVPVDFSEVSYHAAEYAAEMYYHLPNAKVILYHHSTSEDDRQAALSLLESLKSQLESKVFNLEILVDIGSTFIDRLSHLAKEMDAHLIIMGLTGKSNVSLRFSGGNTLKMTEKGICPILVVPPGAKFNKIRNVLITSEMKSIEESHALGPVKEVLEEFKPHVHILNVDSTHYISITEDYKKERDKMEAQLAQFHPQFYFMRLFDFHESVNLFAKDKHIDMIIIAPKHHSFFEKLFKVQHAKELIYQTDIPVLTIQD